MAIIYTYPELTSPQGGDLLLISDVSVKNNPTNRITVDNLATYVRTTFPTNNIEFQGDSGPQGQVNLENEVFNVLGTANEIETSSLDQTLTIGLPDDVTITNDLTVNNDTSISGSLSVLNTLTVNDNQGNGSTIDSLLSMDSNRIINLSNPVNAQDAATKDYVDTAVTGLLEFKGTFNAATGEILSGGNTGSYLYNCPGGAGTRVAVLIGDYYVVANTAGQFYCSGDLLQIGDSVFAVADAAADSSTINDWGIVEGDNIEGSGTANTIPVWTDSQVLGDSLITSVVDGIFPGSKQLTFDATSGSTFLGGATLEAGNLDVNRGGADMIKLQGAYDGNYNYGVMVLRKTSSHVVTQISAQDTQSAITYFNSPATGQETTNSALRIDNATRKVYLPETYTASGATTDRNLIIGTDGEIKIGANPNVGTGTTNDIVRFTDGPNGVIGDSGMSDNGNVIQLDSSRNFNITRTFGSNNIQSRILVGAGVAANDLALDVKQKAYVRAGLVVSPNPSGVQVDDSSLVVGAGNNDIVSGSDHCLTVGSGNQIISDSDRSVSFGLNNETKQSDNSMNVGNTNLLRYSNNSHIIGQNNQMGDDYQSGTAGFNNSLVIGSDNLLLTDDGSPNPPNGGLSFVIGHDNELRHTETNSFTFGYSIANKGGASTAHRNDFNVGGDLTAVNQTMTLGYRNDANIYPAENNTVGLGATKFVVAVGSNTTSDANALLITEGGINKSNQPQIPRIIFPTLTAFNFADDTAAATGGIPVGGLYHNAGALRIRLT